MNEESVETAIQALLSQEGEFRSGDLARRTGLSRQALHRHLVRATESGLLVREGSGRGTRYRASRSVPFDRSYSTDGLEEDAVVRELEAWLASTGLERSAGADAILNYAVAEVVNNAIDHSGAGTVRLEAELHDDHIQLDISDPGIGAFESLRSRLGLEDHLHALQELSKGKATTQPERHTGEGLFFTSKMVESFELTANGLTWIVDNALSDQTVRAAEPSPGTQVTLTLSLQTPTSPVEVFERYTHDYQFDKTRCVVRLFEHGVTFVSRSEAKRLVANLERFREVILDFHGVPSVGQGFVDEVFRVWARAHPEVRLTPTEMNREVEFMVRRGLARAGEDDAST